MKNQARRFGIPYAYALEDGTDGVICPICKKVCRGLDESQETYEDAATKGASAAYAVHYAQEHGDEES